MKTRMLLGVLVVFACSSAASAQRQHSPRVANDSTELQNRIAKATEGLSWESEGSDRPRVFFLPVAPLVRGTGQKGTFTAETVKDIEDQLRTWVKKLPRTYRPEGYNIIETQSLEDLVDDVLNPEPDKNGVVYEPDAQASAKWAVLKSIVDELTDLQAYWMGSEINYQLIVVCGIDAHGNLVGFWMRHWSS